MIWGIEKNQDQYNNSTVVSMQDTHTHAQRERESNEPTFRLIDNKKRRAMVVHLRATVLRSKSQSTETKALFRILLSFLHALPKTDNETDWDPCIGSKPTTTLTVILTRGIMNSHPH